MNNKISCDHNSLRADVMLQREENRTTKTIDTLQSVCSTDQTTHGPTMDIAHQADGLHTTEPSSDYLYTTNIFSNGNQPHQPKVL